MRTLIVLTCVTSLGLGLGAAASAPQRRDAATSDLAVTGYALGSATDRLIDRNAAGLTTVTVAGVTLSADGTRVRRPSSEVNRVAAAAHRDGLRADLLLSNYNDRLGDFDPRAAHRLLGDEDRIAAVAKRMVGLAVDGGWDGVNLDLESLRRSDGTGLVSLARQISDRADETTEGALTVSIDVSARTSASAYRDAGYRLRQLGAAVDLIQLMTYDQHGPSWSGPGPIGGLGWQHTAVREALKAVPPEQVDLGVAGYGYTWPRRGTGRTVTVAGARRLTADDGTKPRWVARQGEWRARLSNGTQLWWSDRRSFAARRALADELGLHGLALWRLGSADRLQ